MKTHHAEIILCDESGCTRAFTSMTINDFHTNIENAFYTFVGGKKVLFFRFSFVFIWRKFLSDANANARTQQNYHCCKQKYHFNGIGARLPHSMAPHHEYQMQ